MRVLSVIEVPLFEKRYTQGALDAWFKRYQSDWETRYFTSKELLRGQQTYAQSVLRSLEIEERVLVVTGRWNKAHFFVTLEIDALGQWHVHISQEPLWVGRALLVAALYVLEDLFQQHLEWLSIGLETTKPVSAKGNSKNSQENTLPKEIKNLCKVNFFKEDQALSFSVFIKKQGTFVRVEDVHVDMEPRERESFLQIMHWAQKAGFRWTKNVFRNEDSGRFQEFVTHQLPKWGQNFFVEVDESVKNVEKGIKPIAIELQSKPGGLWHSFWADDQLLSAEEVEKSLRTKRGTYWSERHGLLQWQAKEKAWLQRVNAWKSRWQEGEFPCYLAFSLFCPEKITRSESMKLWIRQVQTLPSQGETEGAFFANFLRSYQRQGVLWMKHLLENQCHPLLADEMGLGKTLQVLALLQRFGNKSKQKYDDLIVCPASVLSVWQNECERFFPNLKIRLLSKEVLNSIPEGHEVARIQEPKNPWQQETTGVTTPSEKYDCLPSAVGQKKANLKAAEDNTLFLASYTQLRQMSAKLRSLKFRFVILDEAQYIKNPKSKTAQACFGLDAVHRVALTGTPLENKFLDLWTLFHFLMPGLLGDCKEFKAYVSTEEGKHRLAIQLAPFILRRTKDKVLQELPEKVETAVYCPLTEAQKLHYKKWIKQKETLQLGNWGHLFTLLLRLRQICCDVGLLPENTTWDVEQNAKVQWLRPKIAECFRQKRKIVLFSQFRRFLERLFPLVSSIYGQTFVLTGETAVHKRRRLVEQFQKSDLGAFLISLKAGGMGITLHSADTVFLLDPWWNPAVETQAIDRLHRLGQKKPVWVYRLLTKNSVEENVQALQGVKKEQFSMLFDRTSNLSPEERWKRLYDLL